MTDQILQDKQLNNQMAENMRTCLVFYAGLTRTKLKKKPDEYTMHEMLDLMDKMTKRLKSPIGRMRARIMDFFNIGG